MTAEGETPAIKNTVTLRNSKTGEQQNAEVTGSQNFVVGFLQGLIDRFGPNANIGDVVKASGVKPGETTKFPQAAPGASEEKPAA